MPSGPTPICLKCKHDGVETVLPDGAVVETCKAFYPEPIPEEILLTKVIHVEPYPGDHGLQFEEKPDA